MKTLTLLALTAVLLPSLAYAAPGDPGGPREEVRGVSFQAPDANGRTHTYYIACDNMATTLQNCRGAAIWEDDNGLGGIQTSRVHAGRWFEKDSRLTP